jgi:hypothetical protein
MCNHGNLIIELYKRNLFDANKIEMYLDTLFREFEQNSDISGNCLETAAKVITTLHLGIAPIWSEQLTKYSKQFPVIEKLLHNNSLREGKFCVKGLQ